MRDRAKHRPSIAAKLAAIHRRMAHVSEEEAMVAIRAVDEGQPERVPDAPVAARQGDGECVPRHESDSTQTA